jgi:hypothetical protein
MFSAKSFSTRSFSTDSYFFPSTILRWIKILIPFKSKDFAQLNLATAAYSSLKFSDVLNIPLLVNRYKYADVPVKSNIFRTLHLSTWPAAFIKPATMLFSRLNLQTKDFAQPLETAKLSTHLLPQTKNNVQNTLVANAFAKLHITANQAINNE